MRQRAKPTTRAGADPGYLDDELRERLARNFVYHPPKATQVDRYEELRREGKLFAETIGRLCPPSPERSTALRYVEESVMNANAAIARHEVD